MKRLRKAGNEKTAAGDYPGPWLRPLKFQRERSGYRDPSDIFKEVNPSDSNLTLYCLNYSNAFWHQEQVIRNKTER